MEDIITFNTAKLDCLLEEYVSRKEKFEAEKKELEAMNKQIVNMLAKQSLTDYANDKHSAKLVYKTTYKYKDEEKLLSRIKDDESLKKFVITSVDTKSLTETIKKSPSVASNLVDLYDINTSTSLTVK